MTKRICHISTVHKSSDIRIFLKECVFLAKEGYDVYYLNTSGHDDDVQNVYTNLKSSEK